ncbi:hypothetical protein EYF80_012546 [Liparis tanakae]|uniref:Secreted protein n=1 Tax=Liparis tanakae TaxID=230148 RepID=A0A4Z2IGT3_9TELE|nr:hypothetical protein EYF80_012546 [Liparis tanakae]
MPSCSATLCFQVLVLLVASSSFFITLTWYCSSAPCLSCSSCSSCVMAACRAFSLARRSFSSSFFSASVSERARCCRRWNSSSSTLLAASSSSNLLTNTEPADGLLLLPGALLVVQGVLQLAVHVLQLADPLQVLLQLGGLLGHLLLHLLPDLQVDTRRLDHDVGPVAVLQFSLGLEAPSFFFCREVKNRLPLRTYRRLSSLFHLSLDLDCLLRSAPLLSPYEMEVGFSANQRSVQFFLL